MLLAHPLPKGEDMSSATSPVGQPIVDLKDYLRAVWSRRVLVAFVAMLVVAAAAVWTLVQSPMYSAQAKVLVLPAQDPSMPATTITPSQLAAVMTTEAELVRSLAVASRAAAALGHEGPADALVRGLRVGSVTDSNIMLVGYSSPDPATAARAADAFARAYIEVGTERRAAGIERALVPVEAELAATKEAISSLDARIRASAGKDPVLQSERSVLRSQVPVLEAKALELKTAAAANQAGELVSPARPPTSPSSPNIAFNLTAGLLGGLALGSLLALLLNATDKRIRTKQELERRIGAPVLAVIPRVERWLRFHRPMAVSREDPRHPAAEAYGALAANIRYGSSPMPPRVLTVTSSLPGEGKSATVANLAITLAQSGDGVVIISGDLRRPRVHEFFDLDDDKGLTDAITGSMPLSSVIAQTTVPNLSLIPSGSPPEVAGAFLARLRASSLVRELRDLFDIVIIDSPPVLPVADAAVLASMSDGVLFVYDPAISSGTAVTESRERLRGTGARIIGAVLNNVGPGGDRYYGGRSYPDAGEGDAP
jgi:succinoglycan biosynthesis transport protein ExoP